MRKRWRTQTWIVVAIAMTVVVGSGVAFAAAGDGWSGSGPLDYGTRYYTHPLNSVWGAWDATWTITFNDSQHQGDVLIAKGHMFGAPDMTALGWAGGPIGFRSTSVKLLNPAGNVICRQGKLYFGGTSHYLAGAELQMPKTCTALPGTQYPTLNLQTDDGTAVMDIYQR
jgi:hypothetical protein